MGVFLAYFFYAKANYRSPEEAVVAKIRQIIDLPEDEQPTVATVADRSKLGKESFFAEAEEGDVILVYDRAAKVILFRPATNLVIEVANLNLEK